MPENQTIKVVLLTEQDEDSLLSSMLQQEYAACEKHPVTLVENTEILTSVGSGADVIVVDSDMDEESRRCLKTIRNLYPDTPTILVTADEDAANRTIEDGASDFLLRDQLDARLVNKTIRHVMSQARLLGQLQEARKSGHLAYCDAVTSLPNRLSFQSTLYSILRHADTIHRRFALVFLDIDGFKRINDTLGHSAGDLLLKTCADRLSGNTRGVDVVSRIGGDEFSIILKGVGENTDISKVVEKLQKVIAEPIDVEGRELCPSISAGVSVYPLDGTDGDTLIKRADIAMNRAKSLGRNQCEFYQMSMDCQFDELLSLENNIRRAVERGELVLYYQPQLSLTTGTIVGVEALLRWQHPEFGLLMPERFIHLAEETGAIAHLDQWAFSRACRTLKMWQDMGFVNLRVSVNLSALDFRYKYLAETIEKSIGRHQLRAEDVCVEFTETAIIKNNMAVTKILQKLSEMGLQLSVDDFGTGYSSFNYLKSFPLNILKIDRSFVSGIPRDLYDKEISTSIVNLAKNLGLRVIAEGVETREQEQFFEGIGCDEGQGFYFSRPLSEEMMTEFFKSTRFHVS